MTEPVNIVNHLPSEVEKFVPYRGDVRVCMPEGENLTLARAIKEIYALRQITRDYPRNVYVRLNSAVEASELATLLKEGRIECGADEFRIPVGQGVLIIEWGA